jgi:hypothetical protein
MSAKDLNKVRRDLERPTSAQAGGGASTLSTPAPRRRIATLLGDVYKDLPLTRAFSKIALSPRGYVAILQGPKRHAGQRA